MLINLLEVWKKHNEDNIQKYQNTFVFDKSPECIFVKNKNLEPVTFYNELDEVELTLKEKQTAKDKCKEILANGDYDGDLFLLRNLIYNPDNNILYIECVRTKFSVINSLSIQRRNELGLYKVSVLSPTITTDDELIFFERSKGDKQYCSIAGFLESKIGENGNISNLILRTAIEENIEELYGENFICLDQKLFNFKGISFTKNRGFVEFIVGVNIKSSTNNFLNIFKYSHAKDRQEHTQNFLIIPIKSSTGTILAINCSKIGEFFYIPISIIYSEYTNHNNILFKPKFADKNCEKFTSLNSFQFKTKVCKQVPYNISTEKIVGGEQLKNNNYFLDKITSKKSENVRSVHVG